MRPDARADSTRIEYVAHVARSLELIGENSAQASADAKTIFDLETTIAKITIPQADMRDPVATYHKMTVGRFQQTTPHLELDAISPAAPHDICGRRQRTRAELLQGARLAHRGDAGRRLEGVPALARDQRRHGIRSARRSATRHFAGSSSRPA